MQRKLLLTLCTILLAQASIFPQITEVFAKKYSAYNDGQGKSIIQTLDGGYALTGTFTNNQTWEHKHYLIRTDSQGNIIWDKQFWSYTHHWDCNVQLTLDNGFIVCGGGTDGRLIKFDESGDSIWSKSYGDEGYQFGRYGIQTSDSGFAFTGSNDSILFEEGMDPKIWLVKTDKAGDTLWTKTFDESGMGISVLQTTHKGYLITGEATIEEEDCSGFFLARTDSSGYTEWSNIWFSENAWWCRPEDTQQTNDGGYITVGVTADTQQVCSAYIIKTDASGDTAWTKKIKKGAWTWAYSVQQMDNGNYIIAAKSGAKLITSMEGYVNPDKIDVWIFSLNTAGEIEWEETLGGPQNDAIHCLHKNSDDSYIFTGGYGIAQYNYDPWLVKFTIGENTGINKRILSQEKIQLKQNFPNPCNLQTTIRYNLYNSCHVILIIYNTLGQEIEILQDGYQTAGEHNISWQPIGLPNGIYYYSLQTNAPSIKTENSILETKRIILQK